MANKIIWEYKKGLGNVLAEWEGRVKFEKRELLVATIRKFKANEYCLPAFMFPVNKVLLNRKTKTLLAAKNKCQQWWNKFIDSQSS